MKHVYRAGWTITRPIGLFFFHFAAEPWLWINAWFKQRMEA